VGDKIDALDAELAEVDDQLDSLMAVIPNVPFEQVVAGGEEDNQVVKEWGEKPEFDFEPKPHWDLGPELGIINFEQGVRVTGSRFYVLSGPGARLQRALIAWMLDLHIRQGYTEKYTPFIVREETVFGAGQLPKFKENLYKDYEEDLYLVPTAEVPLTGLHMDSILDEEELPLRYTAYSPSFRREKMSAGRDVRGIKRGHQFDKVEMYKFTRPEDAEAEFEAMVANAEETCQLLGLPYRLLLKAAGDTSEAAHISYDIEVWAAGCQEWLEVSSISLVGDFQARRAAIRYRPSDGKGTRFVHTINGSGLGLPRTLIGVLENNQQADGSILVPEILMPWMGGIDVIRLEEKHA
jgi:seryl-tRNA synthetase